jgi:hypothetical protein
MSRLLSRLLSLVHSARWSLSWRRPALLILCLPALAALFLPGLSRPPAPGQLKADLAGWSVADLVRHLEGRGLGLRGVPTQKGGQITINAFLVRGERPWEELNGLVKDPRQVGRWAGMVFCEPVPTDEAAEVRAEVMGDGVLRVGPFLFFGDPQLLQEIRAALALPAAPPED